MKMIKIMISQAASILIVLAGQAQGTFQNLDFEQANPIPIFGNYIVTAASALPSWTVIIGGVGQTQVYYNSPSTGAPAVTLLGPPPPTAGYPVIDGNYSVLLQGSFPSSIPSISQTGLIPAGTQNLLFKADAGNGSLGVSIGNENVPFSAIGTGANYTLYAANISAWAGQTEQLTFSALQDTFSINNWVIDDIAFSPNAVVPEPSTVALTGFGGLLFALSRRFVPKR
jgi:hypothetical protein